MPRNLTILDRATRSLSTFLRAHPHDITGARHCTRTRQPPTSYIHTYIREEKRRKNTCWPGKYVAEEKGKARARRKSRQEVIWWGGGMGKRRGAREEREESREKRNCRALKSPKRQGALAESNTNERTNERKLQPRHRVWRRRRCSVEEGTKDEGEEVVRSRAERSRSRHWPVERGGKKRIHTGNPCKDI